MHIRRDTTEGAESITQHGQSHDLWLHSIVVLWSEAGVYTSKQLDRGTNDRRAVA